ncbi:MAG: glycosyltransferase family 2 protein [Betaproteobacteria bacterium]|nr:glycosyltransferase family 2 protein [Betaproteobacteria bacterium]
MTKDTTPKTVSFVLPFFNEQGNIGKFFEQLLAVLAPLNTYRFELILVDDGSRDGTLGELRRFCRSIPLVGPLTAHLVVFTRNFGKEVAMTAGLDISTGDAVIIMDTDLQHPPGSIPEFLAQWEAGAKLVIGQRTNRKTDTLVYRIFAGLFHAIHNKLSNINLPRGTGDFRLVDREIVAQLVTLRERQRFLRGLFAWLGYEPCIVTYDVQSRHQGRSSFTHWRSWNLALEGITSFSTAPIRLWTYLGLVVAIAGFGYGFYVVLITVLYGIQTPGYASLVSLVLLIGGLNLIGLGMMGEYIGRIHAEVKDRPIYVIKTHETF